MYFSYVPSIKFSFFNRPLFLNLLFNRFIIIIIIILLLIIFFLKNEPSAVGAPRWGPPGIARQKRQFEENIKKRKSHCLENIFF